MPGEGSDREQIGALDWMPGAVASECPARYQTIQVDMAHQGLAPGVQHRRHPRLTVQALGVRAEGREGCPCRLEQQAIDHLGMDLHPTVEGCRQGEDQVVMGHRQHRRELAFTPRRGGPLLTAGNADRDKRDKGSDDPRSRRIPAQSRPRPRCGSPEGDDKPATGGGLIRAGQQPRNTLRALGQGYIEVDRGPGEHLDIEEADAVVGQAYARRGKLALDDKVLEIALEIGPPERVGGRGLSPLQEVTRDGGGFSVVARSRGARAEK